MNAGRKVHGYLPNETPPTGQLIMLGFQYVLTVFPATVFVAAFTGFHVDTVLLASGVSTILALTLSRRGIGSFILHSCGSSFSYIAAYRPRAAKSHVLRGEPTGQDTFRTSRRADRVRSGEWLGGRIWYSPG